MSRCGRMELGRDGRMARGCGEEDDLLCIRVQNAVTSVVLSCFFVNPLVVSCCPCPPWVRTSFTGSSSSDALLLFMPRPCREFLISSRRLYHPPHFYDIRPSSASRGPVRKNTSDKCSAFAQLITSQT
eukprot:754585-Hanusia_phi.AAC.4